MTEAHAQKKIVIICPVFNEEQAVPLFYERIKKVITSVPNYDFELLFCNNRSTDKTMSKIRDIQQHDSKVKLITFSRNFGYQASVLAGLTHAGGDAVVIIDVDCEDPPELIPTFVKKWNEGSDICYGIRGKREESRIITLCRLVFYRILKFAADTDIILDMAEFSLLSKRVKESIIKNSNTYPFLRAEIAYSGFRKTGIHYDRQKRIVGESKYNLWRMALFAVAGILSVSTFPLRLPVYLLPFVLLLNLLGFTLWNSPLAFQSLMLLNSLYLIFLITAHGLYLARIYKNGIGRPVFIVDWDESDVSLDTRGI